MSLNVDQLFVNVCHVQSTGRVLRRERMLHDIHFI